MVLYHDLMRTQKTIDMNENCIPLKVDRMDQVAVMTCHLDTAILFLPDIRLPVILVSVVQRLFWIKCHRRLLFDSIHFGVHVYASNNHRHSGSMHLCQSVAF